MTILDRIAESRLRRVREARASRPLEGLAEKARSSPPSVDAGRRLEAWPPDRRAVIAEVKRRSPSKGILRADLDATWLARAYAAAGAFAISVLTEPDFFGGSLGDLEAVRSAVELPVLYKDFVVDPYQLHEARAAGADLVLLIVALLGERTGEFVALAREIGVEPLLEVHGREELGVALAAGARFVGINNRNLKTFRVDLDVTRNLLPEIPGEVFAVSESGIRGPREMEDLTRRGARAFLVGETLVRAEDPEAALRILVGASR